MVKTNKEIEDEMAKELLSTDISQLMHTLPYAEVNIDLAKEALLKEMLGKLNITVKGGEE